MAFNVDYTPMGAVGGLAYGAGIGQYAQHQQQLAMQAAQQAQAQQQQYVEHVQNLGANQWSQMYHGALANQQAQQGTQFDAWRQMQGQQMQMLQQQQQAKQQMLHDRYGMGAHLMGDISDLEQKGFQYAPADQSQIDKLDGSLRKVLTSPDFDQNDRMEAQAQYWQQRSMIRPKTPPPKPPQTVKDENTVYHTFPDGTKVAGTLVTRNGSVQFDAIENPAEKNKFVAEQTQLKMAHADQMQQMKLQADAAKLQMSMAEHQMKMQVAQQTAEQKAIDAKIKQVHDASLKALMLKMNAKAPKSELGADGKLATSGPSIEEQHAAIDKQFLASHGGLAKQYAPDLFQMHGGTLDQFPDFGGSGPDNMQQATPPAAHGVPQQAQGQSPPPVAPAGALPVMHSPEEALATMKPGEWFMTPDGKKLRIPIK